jgi:hypothetical protein
MRCSTPANLYPFRNIVDGAIGYVFGNLEGGLGPVRMLPSLPGTWDRPVGDMAGRFKRLLQKEKSVHVYNGSQSIARTVSSSFGSSDGRA